MNPLFLIILAVGVVYYFKFRAAQRLQIEVGFPALQSIGISGGFLRFDLPITLLNATRTSIYIQSIDLDLYASGNRVGKAFWSSPQTIGAGGQTKIFVRCALGLTALILGGIGGVVAELQGRSLTLKVQGDVTAEGLTFPIDSETKLTVPKFI